MGYVESWLKGQRESRTADLIVDNTLRQLKERSKVMDKYMPLKTKDGRDWLAYITEQIDPIASLVAPGAEYPSTKKGQFSQVQAKLAKAALRHEWQEDIQWKMKEVKEFANARGITVQNVAIAPGKVQVGQDNSLAELIFGTIQSLVRGHINLLDYLAWQVLQTGKMAYNDTRTGLNIDLDWTKSGVRVTYNHFPDPLTGTRKWTDLENANAIQDLIDMHHVYKYDNGSGSPADEIAMSEELLNLMLRQQSTKEAVVSSMTVGSTMTGTPSMEQLNEVLRRRFLPPVVTVDDHFELDGDNTGKGVATRYLDMNRVVFLKKGMGERVLGGTLENKGKGGIYQRTYEKQKEPPLDITATASQMIVIAPTIAKQGMSRIVADIADIENTMNLDDFAL